MRSSLFYFLVRISLYFPAAFQDDQSFLARKHMEIGTIFAFRILSLESSVEDIVFASFCSTISSMTNPGGSRPIPFLLTSYSLKIKVPDESFSSEHHATRSSQSFSKPLPRPFYTVDHLLSIFYTSKTISSPPLYPPSEHPHRFPYGSWLAQRGSLRFGP